jgi:hypothetical protein
MGFAQSFDMPYSGGLKFADLSWWKWSSGDTYVKEALFSLFRRQWLQFGCIVYSKLFCPAQWRASPYKFLFH